MLRQAIRYYHTLSHLKSAQTIGRVYPEIKKRAALRGWTLTRLPAPPFALSGRLQTATGFLAHDPWNTREAILEGRFCFLHCQERLGRPVAWEAAGLPILWRYNLHYFHYLHLLRPEEQRALCLDWVRHHPPGTGAAWHPFPTSLRIANWCKQDVQDQALLRSLYRQAAYLHRNTEFYLLGNHYLENARALVLAGWYFNGQGEASQWLAHGLRIYREQTPEQILRDGGHFERSPMYHALMLEGYLDVLNVLPTAHADRPWFEDVAQRMADFLYSVTHPDGRISLFNDASHEVAPGTAQLLGYAKTLMDYQAVRRPAFPETGYYIHADADADVYLIIDGGPIGPDYLPAHAHADVFSYELSLKEQRFVVDSGVYEYVAGPMRAYARSTRAHNTVCIDGMDQVECWGSFRVARRSSPRDVRYKQQDGVSTFSGRFGGYGKIIGDGIVHRREMRYEQESKRLTVTDVVEGGGAHRVASRIHLHPDVEVMREGDQLVLERQQIRCVFRTDAPVSLEKGWYSPEFGKRAENTVLVLGGTYDLPVALRYSITREG